MLSLQLTLNDNDRLASFLSPDQVDYCTEDLQTCASEGIAFLTLSSLLISVTCTSTLLMCRRCSPSNLTRVAISTPVCEVPDESEPLFSPSHLYLSGDLMKNCSVHSSNKRGLKLHNEGFEEKAPNTPNLRRSAARRLQPVNTSRPSKNSVASFRRGLRKNLPRGHKTSTFLQFLCGRHNFNSRKQIKSPSPK
jgi:hypothetical protein